MSLLDVARKVVETEVAGLMYMSSRLDIDFEHAVNEIISTDGRVIICGMGKSGIIGKKIAASFASTGTPSFFMHPGEAFHGDLGMVKSEDVFIAISNSGETDELLKLIPFLKNNGNYIVAMTGNKLSTLARNAHCLLDISVPKEACPLQLAPTSSTTATLVMGDALTIALMEQRNFQPENFARFHPGGSLGRRLLARVADEMTSQNLPLVKLDSDFTTIINAVSSGCIGLALVDVGGNNMAIITDGDLRRALEEKGKQAFDLKAKDIASFSPTSIQSSASIQDAYEEMERKSITSLLVVDGIEFVGVLKH
ncbi:KpsF/GutQ family sugar-phosphate isomerase [Vibrio splendidus]|uniref:KpsF/GutQ family sugar-phosphate isomerase n=1 Tax=Vibrio splendidus TaxID=29497 RepID=UPI000C818AEC|nr:KpsF/GutQ family sugar-phosphate isomerase [Vibrio splendidus]PMO71082.1 arabinose-5-phosphate isomerase [Vibrio splendidus]